MGVEIMKCIDCGMIFMDGTADGESECPKCGGRLTSYDPDFLRDSLREARMFMADAVSGRAATR